MKKRGPAVAARKPAGDDAIAAQIVDELSPDPPITKAIAIHFVKSKIKELRAAMRMANKEPRPREAGEATEEIAKRAKALASRIKRLNADWRLALCWSVFDGSLYQSPRQADAQAKLTDWISVLDRISQDFGRTPERLRYFSPEPKERCVRAARVLFSALSPKTRLTKGASSKFYEVTSWLWEAATGETDRNMKRTCDRSIDLFKGLERQWRDSLQPFPLSFAELEGNSILSNVSEMPSPGESFARRLGGSRVTAEKRHGNAVAAVGRQK